MSKENQNISWFDELRLNISSVLHQIAFYIKPADPSETNLALDGKLLAKSICDCFDKQYKNRIRIREIFNRYKELYKKSCPVKDEREMAGLMRKIPLNVPVKAQRVRHDGGTCLMVDDLCTAFLKSNSVE